MISSSAVATFGGFVRHDQYNYYPSNVFADLGPINSETIAQDRQLSNTGVHGDISWVKGIHNIKAGAVYQQTFLTENDHFGIIDPNLLPSTRLRPLTPFYLYARNRDETVLLCKRIASRGNPALGRRSCNSTGYFP